MEVIIQKDAATAIDLTARLICDAVQEKKDSVLGLATGRTMENLYANIVKRYENDEVSFSRCATFNLDEYVGLEPDNKQSYRYYMNDLLFNKINIDLEETFLPNGVAADLAKSCQQYEEKIIDKGGIDIQLLGIGNTGHIGFNEPLSSLASRTREKALAPITLEQNGPLFDDPEEMPKRALTMGVGTILDAKKIILLATGKTKASILAKAVEGPITSMISASALQLHPNCVIICDEDAAEELEGKEYYHRIFANEPEWQKYH